MMLHQNLIELKEGSFIRHSFLFDGHEDLDPVNKIKQNLMQ